MIQILQNDLIELERKLIEEDKKQESIETDLDNKTKSTLKNILSEPSFSRFCQDVSTRDYLKTLDYEKLCQIKDILNIISDSISKVKDDVDVKIFFQNGKTLDLKKLRDKFNKRGLKAKYPNFNFKRLRELYEKPPEKLATYYSDSEFILIDKFVFRKFIIGLIQMVFNHMDLLIAYTGAEGSGKSTKVSQDILMVHWILGEIGVADYKFDIQEMFFNTLQKFQDAEDKYFKNPFRILALDEGNQLNRQDWKDEEVKMFFQRLRRERHNQRIKFICIPVLGEMITNIILTRMNFVFDLKMKNDVKDGTLLKGIVDMFIVPRGNKIYSPAQQKELTQGYIKTTLYENLKDKSYLKGVPNELLIKRFKSNGTWGFREKDYIKYLKDANETFSVTKGITFTDTELFYFYKANITMKRLGIPAKTQGYHTVFKMINKINNYFEKNPDLLLKHETIYNRKMASKE